MELLNSPDFTLWIDLETSPIEHDSARRWTKGCVTLESCERYRLPVLRLQTIVHYSSVAFTILTAWERTRGNEFNLQEGQVKCMEISVSVQEWNTKMSGESVALVQWEYFERSTCNSTTVQVHGFLFSFVVKGQKCQQFKITCESAWITQWSGCPTETMGDLKNMYGRDFMKLLQ